MGEKAITGIVGIVSAVIAVAIIAVLVSKQANTGGVLKSAGEALSGILKAAVSPVSGGSLGSGLFGN